MRLALAFALSFVALSARADGGPTLQDAKIDKLSKRCATMMSEVRRTHCYIDLQRLDPETHIPPPKTSSEADLREQFGLRSRADDKAAKPKSN